MIITNHLIDLNRHAEAVPSPRPGNMDDLPQDVIERRPADIWVVAHGPIVMTEPVRWCHHKKGTHIVIPLFPYVLAPRPTEALGYMLQLGLCCASGLGRNISRIHLSLGHPVHQFVADPQLGDGWQFWAGFGLILEG